MARDENDIATIIDIVLLPGPDRNTSKISPQMNW